MPATPKLDAAQHTGDGVRGATASLMMPTRHCSPLARLRKSATTPAAEGARQKAFVNHTSAFGYGGHYSRSRKEMPSSHLRSGAGCGGDGADIPRTGSWSYRSSYLSRRCWFSRRTDRLLRLRMLYAATRSDSDGQGCDVHSGLLASTSVSTPCLKISD